MKNTIIKIILISLVIHLFINNQGLLMFTTPDQEYSKILFSVIKSISYALATALIIGYSPKLYFIVPFALIDGTGVFMYILNNDWWNQNLNTYASYYYGIYTAALIAATGIISMAEKKSKTKALVDENKNQKDEIEKLKNEIKQREIKISQLQNEAIIFDSTISQFQKVISAKEEIIAQRDLELHQCKNDLDFNNEYLLDFNDLKKSYRKLKLKFHKLQNKQNEISFVADLETDDIEENYLIELSEGMRIYSTSTLQKELNKQSFQNLEGLNQDNERTEIVKHDKEELVKLIFQMKQDRISQKEIAIKTKLSEATVSRILNSQA